MKNKKKAKPVGRIIAVLFIRLIILAAVVVGYSLPMPYRIIVPLSIGTVLILFETFACLASKGKK